MQAAVSSAVADDLMGHPGPSPDVVQAMLPRISFGGELTCDWGVILASGHIYAVGV